MYLDPQEQKSRRSRGTYVQSKSHISSTEIHPPFSSPSVKPVLPFSNRFEMPFLCMYAVSSHFEARAVSKRLAERIFHMLGFVHEHHVKSLVAQWAKACKRAKNSRGSGGGDGLCDLGHLVAGADDLLTLTVLVELHVLVLPLCSLPDLDFAATADDTDSHGGEEVVGGVGVHVDSTVEHGGGIFADAAVDHGLASRMLLDEVCDVVNHTGNGDETAAILCLVLEVVPFHDW